METTPEKVIAMVANVAAFGLCGSSQNVGTEVKSSSKESGKVNTTLRLRWFYTRTGQERAANVCKSGENGEILTLSRLDLTHIYIP